ncbi:MULTISPECIES: hypothetical protein [unclassified Burkholderia]|nr:MULTISPECIES: hypothetical protein [unclassified Burkholderia]
MFDRIARGAVPCVRSPASGGCACANARPRAEFKYIVFLIISNRIIPS